MRTVLHAGGRAGLALVVVAALLAAWNPAALAGEDAAGRAALAWLGLVDRENHEQSWQTAGELFKGAVTAQNWASQIQAVRKPLGKVLSRHEAARKNYKQLPGAPDGDYLIFSFQTVFQNKAQAMETLTMQREADGAWRSVGYYIR